MKIDRNCEYISFQHIPTKSLDFSPTDYFAFDLFKIALSSRKLSTIDELWKVVEKERKLMPLEI